MLACSSKQKQFPACGTFGDFRVSSQSVPTSPSKWAQKSAQWASRTALSFQRRNNASSDAIQPASRYYFSFPIMSDFLFWTASYGSNDGVQVGQCFGGNGYGSFREPYKEGCSYSASPEGNLGLLIGLPRGIPARVLSVRQNTFFTATIKDVEPDFIFVLGTNSVFFWCAASSSVGSR